MIIQYHGIHDSSMVLPQYSSERTHSPVCSVYDSLVSVRYGVSLLDRALLMGRRSTSSCSGAAAAIRAAGPPVQPPLTARKNHRDGEEGGGMETPPHSVNRSTDTTHGKQKRADRRSHPALMQQQQQHTDERKHPERVESYYRY